MEERYFCKLVTDLMLIREKNDSKEILLLLRKNTGYKDGEYELPGGHVEAEEDLKGAMVREAKEEILIDIDEKDLEIIYVLHHYTGDRVNFIFTTDKYNGIPKIGEPDKCEKLEWYDMNELPTNVSYKTKLIIENIIKGIKYSNL